MKIFILEKPGYRLGYLSFNRLLRENKQVIQVPVNKSDLPVKISHGQVIIYELEVDEKL